MKFIVLLFVNVLILPARSFSFVSNGHLGNSRCRYQTRHVRSTKLRLAARDDDKDFWNSQKKLMEDMSNAAEKSLQEEQRELFAKKRISLVNDTAYLGFFIFCILWTTYDNPFVAFSYTIGTLMGLAYAYGLGKYVENLGGQNAMDPESLGGSGVGEARFAFLILLFVVVAKFRSQGLVEIPTIAGFFTYQLASLGQAFKLDADE